MRLIDADKLRNGWLYNGANENIYCANDVIDDIDEQPTVDAVEVVRCTKCAKKDYCRIAEYISGMDWSKSFCSDGIKKGGEQE